MKDQKDFIKKYSLGSYLKMPFFISLLDEDENVVFFNKQAEKMTGLKAASVFGNNFTDTFILHETQEVFREYFFKSHLKKKTFKPFTSIFVTKEYKTLYLEWTGIRESLHGRDYLFLIGKELTDSFSAISGILTQIIHDMNNSATFVIGNVPFLRESWNDIKKHLDECYFNDPDLEIARLVYPFFKEDYPQMISDIETGCKRIKHVVAKFKEIERITAHVKKK